MHKILIYLYIIHLLKSSTCFEHCPGHLQEVYVVILYIQPLPEPDSVQQPHAQQYSTYEKPEGCQCSFRPLMMGGVSPETCWASYNNGIIKFWYIVTSCWIFLYELYYDAQIHEDQPAVTFCGFKCGLLLKKYNLVM